MAPGAGIEGGTPSSSSPAYPAPVQAGPPEKKDRPAGTAASQVPWGLVVRLGFVTVVLIVAVTLIALGYTAAAAVGLVLGVGLAAAEIIKRVS
jgi:hypothetical protein